MTGSKWPIIMRVPCVACTVEAAKSSGQAEYKHGGITHEIELTSAANLLYYLGSGAFNVNNGSGPVCIEVMRGTVEKMQGQNLTPEHLAENFTQANEETFSVDLFGDVLQNTSIAPSTPPSSGGGGTAFAAPNVNGQVYISSPMGAGGWEPIGILKEFSVKASVVGFDFPVSQVDIQPDMRGPADVVDKAVLARAIEKLNSQTGNGPNRGKRK